MILFADQAKSASYNMKSSGSLKSMSEAMVALSGVLGFAILIKVFVAKGTKPRSENQEEKDLKTLLEQVTQQYEHENSMQWLDANLLPIQCLLRKNSQFKLSHSSF